MRSLMLLVLLAPCLLTGCSVSPESLARMDTDEVARHYGDTIGNDLTDRRPYEAELRKRNNFTDEERARIQRREIRPGDSSTFVRAAWGRPDGSMTRTSETGASAVGGTTSTRRAPRPRAT